MSAQQPTPPTRVAAPAAELAEQLIAETEKLTDQLVETIWQTDTAYVGGSTSSEDVWRSCFDNIGRVLQTLAGVVPAGIDPYDAPRETGRRRAEQRLPLESVLHSYRVGGRLIWTAMVARSRAGACEPNALLDAATTVWEVVDSFSTEVAMAYRTAEDARVRRDVQQGQVLVAALLNGRGDDPVVVDDVVRALDLRPDGEYAVVVAPADGDRWVRDALAAHRLEVIWSSHESCDVALATLGSRSLDAVRRALQTGAEGPVALAGATGLAQVGLAWTDARLALDTLPTEFRGVVSLAERLPEALLATSPDLARRLVASTLQPLLDLPDGERDVLLATVRTWLDSDRSATRTAERLFCHRNTVLNRLQRVSALTGLTLDSGKNLLTVTLALRALDLPAFS